MALRLGGPSRTRLDSGTGRLSSHSLSHHTQVPQGGASAGARPRGGCGTGRLPSHSSSGSRASRREVPALQHVPGADVVQGACSLIPHSDPVRAAGSRSRMRYRAAALSFLIGTQGEAQGAGTVGADVVQGGCHSIPERQTGSAPRISVPPDGSVSGNYRDGVPWQTNAFPCTTPKKMHPAESKRATVTAPSTRLARRADLRGPSAKHHSTRGSRVIPQRSTNLAQPCLTSEIGRDRVYSEWYDRGMLERPAQRLYSWPPQRREQSRCTLVQGAGLVPTPDANPLASCSTGGVAERTLENRQGQPSTEPLTGRVGRQASHRHACRLPAARAGHPRRRRRDGSR